MIDLAVGTVIFCENLKILLLLNQRQRSNLLDILYIRECVFQKRYLGKMNQIQHG